jgi:hypothetical protein
MLTDALLVLLVLPFGFTLAYFFPLFFSGRNRLALLGDLTALSLSLSWVSCAFLFVVGLALRVMLRRGCRWHALFCVAVLSGGFWLLLWNSVIEPTFTFWRSLIPLALCCFVATGYALGKMLYQNDVLNFADTPQLDFHEGEREVLDGQPLRAGDGEDEGARDAADER